MKRMIAAMMLLLMIFSGCSESNAYQRSIYDDDEKIAAQGDSYTFTKRVGNTNNDGLSLNYQGFSGKQAIWEIHSEKDTIVHMSIDSQVKSGKFKVCLIDCDRTVAILSENTFDEMIAISICAGENRIVIVGYQAAGEIDITFQGNEDLPVFEVVN